MLYIIFLMLDCENLLFYFKSPLYCVHIRLRKQSWGWWSETPSRPLWCHCNVVTYFNDWSGNSFPLAGNFSSLISNICLWYFCLTLLEINMVSTSNQSGGSTKEKHCTKRLLRKTTKQNNKWHRALISNMSWWYFYLPVLEINLFRTSNQSIGSTKGLYFAKGLFRKTTTQNNKWHKKKDLSRDYRWKKPRK